MPRKVGIYLYVPRQYISYMKHLIYIIAHQLTCVHMYTSKDYNYHSIRTPTLRMYSPSHRWQEHYQRIHVVIQQHRQREKSARVKRWNILDWHHQVGSMAEHIIQHHYNPTSTMCWPLGRHTQYRPNIHNLTTFAISLTASSHHPTLLHFWESYKSVCSVYLCFDVLQELGEHIQVGISTRMYYCYWDCDASKVLSIKQQLTPSSTCQQYTWIARVEVVPVFSAIEFTCTMQFRQTLKGSAKHRHVVTKVETAHKGSNWCKCAWGWLRLAPIIWLSDKLTKCFLREITPCLPNHTHIHIFPSDKTFVDVNMAPL